MNKYLGGVLRLHMHDKSPSSVTGTKIKSVITSELIFPVGPFVNPLKSGGHFVLVLSTFYILLVTVITFFYICLEKLGKKKYKSSHEQKGGAGLLELHSPSWYVAVQYWQIFYSCQ